MKDKEIVKLFILRQEEALFLAESKFKLYLTTIAKNILGSTEEAEEIVNETLHVDWNSIPPQNPENLKAYLGKVTRRLSISRYRLLHAEKRRTSEFSISLDEIKEIATDENLSNQIEDKEIAKSVSDFLRSLPRVERQLFVRRYWYGDSIKSLSECFRLSEDNVKVRLFRTREKVKQHLKEKGFIYEK